MSSPDDTTNDHTHTDHTHDTHGTQPAPSGDTPATEQSEPSRLTELHHPKVVNTMKSVSKLVLFAPLVILAVGFYMYYTEPAKPVERVPSIAGSTSPTPTRGPAKKTVKLNLDGPFVCEGVYEGASVSARIKNKQVAATMSQATMSANLVLNGDCVYMWQSVNPGQGQKMCGVGQYVGILGMMSSWGVLDIGSILSSLPFTKNSGLASAEAAFSEISESCVDAPVEDASFVIPADIVFTEGSGGMTTPAPGQMQQMQQLQNQMQNQMQNGTPAGQ
jgi:hypothetical protein